MHNPTNPCTGAKPSYKKVWKVNICREQLEFNNDEWIDRQHDIKIQASTTLWSISSIKSSFEQYQCECRHDLSKPTDLNKSGISVNQKKIIPPNIIVSNTRKNSDRGMNLIRQRPDPFGFLKHTLTLSGF